MKKYKRNTKLLLPVLMVSLFFCTAALAQKTWTRGAGNDNWSSANNWNPVGVPAAADAVIIPDNIAFSTVVINTDATCAGLTINGGSNPLTVTVNAGKSLTVAAAAGGNGIITIGAPTDASSSKIITLPGSDAILTAAAIIMADITIAGTSKATLDVNQGTVLISGNLTLNGSAAENEVTITLGKLVIGGVLNSGGTITPGTGTIEYNGAAQAMRNMIYNNLTVAGSGIKNNAVTVNGKLSIQGSATLQNTVTYGSNAVLEYKGSISQTVSDIEFPVIMPVSVIIDNAFGVRMNNTNKILSGDLYLLTGTFLVSTRLSMGSSGTPLITRAGGFISGTLQSPANDYDVIYTGTSKTTGAELSSSGVRNLTVNLSATETLLLDQNRLTDGSLAITGGTFDLATFTIHRSAPGGILTVNNNAILKIGGTNSLPINYSYAFEDEGIVEYAGTNQVVQAVTYGGCIASGSGNKTVSTSAATYTGRLTIQPNVIFTVGSANFKAGYVTQINGTLICNSITGTKYFGNITINSGGTFNSTVDEDYEVYGNLIINSTGTLIAGSGKWTFTSPNFNLIRGTATFNNVKLDRYYHLEGNLSFKNLEINTGGTITNKDTLNIAESLIGQCTFYQNENSVLNFSGTTLKLSLLTVSAAGNGSSVNFIRQGDQSIVEETSPNEYNYNFENLNFSGSGIKKFLTISKKININGKLSMQGTAGAYLAFADRLTFSGAASLEYAGSIAQTSTNAEFKSPGGPQNIIINNALGVTLHESRTILGTLTLTNGTLTIPATNVFTIANGTTIGGSGFGTAKHINTQVAGSSQGFIRVDKIAANSTYLFPVGNGTYYLPVTLMPSDATAAKNTFSVGVFPGITNNGLPNGTAIVDKSNLVDATWTVNNNFSSTTLPVDMTLGWSGLEGVNFSTLADNLIGIAHYDNPAWGNYSGSGNQLNNTATRSGITSFSPFSVGKLGAFSSALNRISVPDSSNKSVPEKKLTTGVILPGIQNMQLITVLPNPVRHTAQINITSVKKNKVALLIMSAAGKIIYNTTVALQPGENLVSVDVSALSEGIYIIRGLFADGKIAMIKFIK